MEFGIDFRWHNIRMALRKRLRSLKSVSVGFIPKDRGMLALARSRYLAGRPVIMLKKRGLIRRAEVSAVPKIDLSLGEIPEIAEPAENEYWKSYVNAWFKNFNRSHPGVSGILC